jgi:hypothetical protein
MVEVFNGNFILANQGEEETSFAIFDGSKSASGSDDCDEGDTGYTNGQCKWDFQQREDGSYTLESDFDFVVPRYLVVDGQEPDKNRPSRMLAGVIYPMRNVDGMSLDNGMTLTQSET